MNGNSPCETKWYLCYLGFDFAIFLDRPAHIISDDLGSISEFDNWESLISPDDMSYRTIGIPCIEVIFDEHDSCSDLENKSLGCETSLLECFDELVSSLGLHLEDEYIFADSIESFSIIGVDGNIFGKEFCMILCLNSYIARCEEFS